MWCRLVLVLNCYALVVGGFCGWVLMIGLVCGVF